MAAHWRHLVPTPAQQQSVEELRDRIVRHAQECVGRLARDSDDDRAPDLPDRPGSSNCFGVFGPRGSGKSTVLQWLGSSLEETGEANRAAGEKCPRIEVLQGLDCSLSPRGVPLGLSIVRRLRELLHAKHHGFAGRDAARDDDDDAYERIESAYLRCMNDYRDAIHEVAVSPQHLAKAIRQDIDERFALPALIDSWLHAEAMRHAADVFVLPLDDVELGQDDAPSTLLWSLLDELHRDRLLLLVAADRDLWERRIRADPHVRLDPQTVTALLTKALPEDHSVRLRPWTIDERLLFPPHAAQAEELRPMGDLLRRSQHAMPFLAEHPGLLPAYPRGLTMLWNRLRTTPGSARSSAGSDHSNDHGEGLAFVAQCRGEGALAARLAMRPPKHWAGTFESGGRPLAAKAWRSLARAAADVQEPLWSIGSATTPLPLQEVGDDAPLWVEYLVDAALAAGTMQPGEFVERLAPLGQRFSDACLHIEFTRQAISHALEAQRPSVLAEFYWCDWEAPGDTFGATIGLPQALAAIAGERSAWPSGLLAYLAFGRGQVMEGVPPDRHIVDPTTIRTELLPRRVRALIRFVDALSRGPWPALSARSRLLTFGAQARLAAGLVRAAYLVALGLKESDVSQADGPFVSAFDHTRQAAIFGWDERETLARFEALVDAALPPAPKAPNAADAELWRCLRAFVDHMVFRHLSVRL